MAKWSGARRLARVLGEPMAMRHSEFTRIKDWKEFERFCADLLAAEGFAIDSEPFVDRSGKDLLCEEEYRSHTGHVVRLRWRVQCKHFAGSGSHLGREDVEKALVSYQALGDPDHGLILIVDTDYTEAAKDVVDEFTRLHPRSRVALWNQRQLLSRLARHPQVMARYGFAVPQADSAPVFAELSALGPVKTLLISDQSSMAHSIASALRVAGFAVTFLPFWNYFNTTRLDLFEDTLASTDFGLTIVLLGDSFGFDLPLPVLAAIERAHSRGGPLLIFPFLAWTLDKGKYHSLLPIVPVRLQKRGSMCDDIDVGRLSGGYRHGDFGWLLAFDSFAENEYVEYDPTRNKSPLVMGLDSSFGLTHSFEYLAPLPGAEVVVRDTADNPLVILKSGRSRVCYFNSCCHSCMSMTAIPSPFEVSVESQKLLRNVIRWLIAGEPSAGRGRLTTA